MLYPIELLGQVTAGAERAATDGVHVNGQGGFCHVVLRLFECRPLLAQASTVWPRKYGRLRPSCKMHSCTMPSLQIATFRSCIVTLTH